MSKSIIGTFENRNAAEVAIKGMLAEGCSEADVSLLVTDETAGRQFEVEVGNKSKEGMGAGTVVGGALGAAVAGLTAVGTVASGGSLLAAGPLVAALAGAGAGGATGGLVGGLVGMGIPEHEAKLSSTDVEKGSIMIGVNTADDRAEKIKDIMKGSGASNITTH